MTPESVIRTVTPVIAGLILTALAKAGFDIDNDAMILVLNGLLTSAYYVLVRYVGTHYPSAEWLLGSPATPTYDTPREN